MANRGRPRKTAQTLSPEQAAIREARIAAFAHVLAEHLFEGLRKDLAIYARLAAADTRHTLQRPETVIRDAIAEGRLAAQLIDEDKTGGAE